MINRKAKRVRGYRFGVNFTNILWTSFCANATWEDILYLKFFWRKKIVEKLALKMLVKYTCGQSSNLGCHRTKISFNFLQYFVTLKIQWNSVITNNRVNEHSVIKNSFLSQICHFSTQINPVTSSHRYKEQKWTVPMRSL